MTERLKVIDCKFIREILRRFESYFFHYKLNYRQRVRHSFLMRAFEGSNPSNSSNNFIQLTQKIKKGIEPLF